MRRLTRLIRRDRSPRESIYGHIRAHIPLTGPGLRPGGETLPDEPDLEGPLRWAPGALDGVGLRHFSTLENEEHLEHALRSLIQASSQVADLGVVTRLERELGKLDVIAIIDPLIERVRLAGLRADSVHALGRRLATEATKRDPVKVGIALLGTVQGTDSRDVLMTLGRHEEFTLYSAVALANTERDPERTLWDLAKQVTGWGRIGVVERRRDTRRPEIREWILRTGFRNDILNEYLAYIAATTGGLVPALERGKPDDELLAGACDIVSALLDGGPVEDIDDYADAPRALELLLTHLRERAPDLRHFVTVDDIDGWLQRDGDAWGRRFEQGWTRELRERLLDVCRDIKADPRWPDIARRGLDAEDPTEFYRAERAARALGIDTLDANLRRAQTRPGEPPGWFGVMQVVDEERIDQVLAAAEAAIPLDEIATGPADELGLGEEFAQHMELNFVVQALGRFPGRGWKLIAAALRSPVVPDRNIAVSALDEWDRSAWPPEAMPALAAAERIEPDEQIRERMQKLLRGERAPEPEIRIDDWDRQVSADEV